MDTESDGRLPLRGTALSSPSAIEPASGLAPDGLQSTGAVLLRVQLRRTKGWRMPPNTVSVARPGKHGNPFTVGCNPSEFSADLPTTCETVEQAVECYRHFAECWQQITSGRWALPLQGKNLGCWCRLCARHADGKPLGEVCPECDPCHVDVLGPLASVDTHPEGGDPAKTGAPFMSGAARSEAKGDAQ